MNHKTERRTEVPCHATSSQRDGSVLLVVLVVIVVLSLGIYTFAELSYSETQAARMFGRDAQTRAWADSGIEIAMAVLDRRVNLDDDDFYNRPDLFANVLLSESSAARGRGRVSLVAAAENDPQSSGIRFGIGNESGKLNLNVLVKWGLEDVAARQVLLALPEMTLETADAILDWIDSDFKRRPDGAESLYYLGLPQSYWAANKPIKSLEELLMVRGVTPQLLYGEDRNRNGLLDPGEDNGDGILQLGWSAYLTIYSKESNRQLDGEERINLNEEVLATLYDQLEDEYDEQTARFVTAFRMTGPKSESPSGSQPGASPGQAAPGADGAVTKVETATTPTTSTDDSDDPDETPAAKRNREMRKQLNTKPENAKRGGMDLTGGAKVKIKSIYELLDVSSEATIDGKSTTLESPWKTDGRDIRRTLPMLLERVSTTPADVIVGRININHARHEVLVGLPGMSESLAGAIMRSSLAYAGGSTGRDEDRQTTAWLLLERRATLEQMRLLDKYLTARGDVYRAQSIGYFDEGGPTTRLEAVIDATQVPPKLLLYRDFTALGKGYTDSQLSP